MWSAWSTEFQYGQGYTEKPCGGRGSWIKEGLGGGVNTAKSQDTFEWNLSPCKINICQLKKILIVRPVVAQAFNPSSEEAEAGRARVAYRVKFQDSRGNTEKPVSNRQTKILIFPPQTFLPLFYTVFNLKESGYRSLVSIFEHFPRIIHDKILLLKVVSHSNRADGDILLCKISVILPSTAHLF